MKKLLLLALITSSLFSQYNYGENEVIVQRYLEGEKKLVVTYKGQGANEIVVKKAWYFQNGSIEKEISFKSHLDDLMLQSLCKFNSNYPEQGKTKNILLGSIDKSDLKVLVEGIKLAYPNGDKSLSNYKHRLIIVPHEIDESTLA